MCIITKQLELIKEEKELAVPWQTLIEGSPHECCTLEHSAYTTTHQPQLRHT